MKRILATMVMAAMILVLCTGCGAGGAMADYSGAAESDRGPQATYDRGDYDAAYETDDYFPTDEAGAALPTFLDPDNDIGVKLVYTVDLTLQTTAFPEGTRRLLETVEEIGGFVRSSYIEGRSLYRPDDTRYARYTLSIPTRELADFLVRMEDDYNLVRLFQESRDVTARYTGQSGEADVLRQQEQELMAMLEALDEDEQELRVELQAMLYDIRTQISALDSSVGGMDIDIRYSTVTVELYEVLESELAVLGEDDSPFGVRVQETAGKSVGTFVAFLQGFLLWLLGAWPVLLILLLVAVVAIVVWRMVRRSRVAGNNPHEIPQASEQDDRDMGPRDDELR